MSYKTQNICRYATDELTHRKSSRESKLNGRNYEKRGKFLSNDKDGYIWLDEDILP